MCFGASCQPYSQPSTVPPLDAGPALFPFCEEDAVGFAMPMRARLAAASRVPTAEPTSRLFMLAGINVHFARSVGYMHTVPEAR